MLKVIRALRYYSLTELLEEETVEKLAELYDALFRAEKQNSATLTVLKGILYCVEDLSDTKEGKSRTLRTRSLWRILEGKTTVARIDEH